MTTIELRENDLVVHMHGLDVLGALRSSLTVPYAEITGVGLAASIDASHPGWRILGTGMPGYHAGEFRGNEGRAFWDVHGKGENAIVISLNGTGSHDTIVVDVEDPDADVRAILRAASTPR